jgi:hypothetical protein
MSPPRYRTLDGEEVELPLAMERWVLVPRGLARFDPEMAWTLDYDDAPEPEVADPRLDFSAGALLVPVERWNEHAAVEPNLAPCSTEPTGRSVAARRSGSFEASERLSSGSCPRARGDGSVAGDMLGRVIGLLALGYVVGVGAWLRALRDGISGPDVSTGVTLVGAAVLLAWLTGVAGAGSRPRSPTRTRPDLGVALLHRAAAPLGILRAGLAVQLAGFAVLVFLR